MSIQPVTNSPEEGGAGTELVPHTVCFIENEETENDKVTSEETKQPHEEQEGPLPPPVPSVFPTLAPDPYAGFYREESANHEEVEPLTDVRITAIPSTTVNRQYMWLMLFLFTLLTGCGMFLFRLQVVVMGEDDALDPGTFIAFLCLGSLVCQLPYVIHLCRKVTSIRPSKMIAFGMLAGTLNCVGMNGYVLLTTDGGEASLLAPLTSLWVILPVIYGVVVAGDRLSLRRTSGIFFSIGAALLFAFSGGGALDFTEGRTIGLYFLTFCGWGFCTILFQVISMSQSGAFAAGYASNVILFFVTGVIFVAVVHQDITFTLSSGHALVVLGGGLHGLGTVGFIQLCKSMPKEAAVVAPLSSLTVLWPVMLGMVVLGESSNMLKIFGILASVSGVLLMGVRDFVELRDMIFKRKNKSVAYDHINLASDEPIPDLDLTPAVHSAASMTNVTVKDARVDDGFIVLNLEVVVPHDPNAPADIINLPTLTFDHSLHVNKQEVTDEIEADSDQTDLKQLDKETTKFNDSVEKAMNMKYLSQETQTPDVGIDMVEEDQTEQIGKVFTLHNISDSDAT
eukprot:gene8975-1309_t